MEKIISHQIRQIPKVELHRHMDCSVRWSTLAELAPQLGMTWPQSLKEQREQFLVTEPMKDLGSVLNKFLNTQKIYASAEILERIAFEACEDAFNDGVIILELRYAPTYIQDGHGLSFQTIHDAIVRGIERAMKAFPMAVGLLATVQRIKSFQEAERVLNFMLDNKETFLGIDLADNEEGFDPKIFAPIFQKAKAEGLRVTIHSGEIPNPQSAQWVRDSIEILGAERIGHGIQIIQSPEVIEYVVKHKIPLEVCPLSNWLTNSFPSIAAHPIQKLMDLGVIVTVNSDDPGVFASTLSDDYELLHRYHGFGIEDFKSLNRAAFEASFIAESKKAKFREAFFS